MGDPEHSRAATSGYEAVLFDMDGVLLEGAHTPSEVYERAAGDVIDRFDLDASADQRETLGSFHYDDAFRGACGALAVDPRRFWAARERFACRRSNRRLQAGRREPYPDAAAIEALPVPAGIVSNNRQATVAFAADHLFSQSFAVTVGRGRTVAEYRRRKPASDFLERALDALEIDRALYVGDREADVIAAHRAGIDGAFLRRAHNRDVSLEVDPLADIGSLDALTDILSSA